MELEETLAPLGLARLDERGFARIDARLSSLPAICMDLAPGALRAWDFFTRLFALEVAGVPVLVSAYDGGCCLWGPPLVGPDDPRLRPVFEQALDVVDACNRALLGTAFSTRALYLGARWRDAIGGGGAGELAVLPQNREYLYRRDGLASLAGGARKRRRAEAVQFEREHAPLVSGYDEGARAACLALLDRWVARGILPDEDDEKGRRREVLAVRYMLARAALPARAGDLRGIVVRVRGDLVGFSLAEPLGARAPGGQVAILAEKTERGLRGLSSFIFREAARRLAPEGSWINAGEDCSVPGLAFAKQGFAPDEVRETYLAWRPI